MRFAAFLNDNRQSLCCEARKALTAGECHKNPQAHNDVLLEDNKSRPG